MAQTSLHEIRCARCSTSSLALPGGRRSFFIPGTERRYAPDTPFRLTDQVFDLDVDPVRKTFSGTVALQFRVIDPAATRLKLDQRGLEIKEVKVGAKPTPFECDATSLSIVLPAQAVGTEFRVEVRYRIPSPPRRGIYFTGPDEKYPSKPYQLWTQGQDEDSQYWYPVFDSPNQKASVGFTVRVPRGFTAVANGAVGAREIRGEQEEFRFRLEEPIPPYLVSLVVAEFATWEDRGPRGLPVQYFVAPGREAEGRRSFGRTAEMIETFERVLGVPFPYPKYAQTAVQDFIFGGMENASVTTQTDRTLHDERAALEFKSDPLVSHELAHQWFGDLVTCKDWSQAWLNEGFATFMERVWVENRGGVDGGIDEARYYSFQDLRDHLGEDQGQYRRPIVCNSYVEPIDLFDTHLYQKGGLVLNLLRATLGEKPFWASIRRYLNAHRMGHVETIDLIRAIEAETGRNLRKFFDQWVFSAGLPELELTAAYDEKKKQLELTVEQKQTQGKPEVEVQGARIPLFSLDLPVSIATDGAPIELRIAVETARERVVIPCATKPKWVRVDSGGAIPKVMKFPRPKDWLLAQLAEDSDILGRIEAARELCGEAGGPDAGTVARLGEQLVRDSFWGVQAELAGQLGDLGTDAARDALLGGLRISSAKARGAVVRALGQFRGDAKVATALEALFGSEPAYGVEGSVARSWVLARTLPGVPVDAGLGRKLFERLKKQAEVPSQWDQVRVGAFAAVGSCLGLSELAEAREFVFRAIREGSIESRVAAAAAALKWIETSSRELRTQVFEAVAALLEEDRFFLRGRLAPSLILSCRAEAVPLLHRLVEIEIDPRIRRSAQVGAAALAESLSDGQGTALQDLRTEIEKLKAETTKLRERIRNDS